MSFIFFCSPGRFRRRTSYRLGFGSRERGFLRCNSFFSYFWQLICSVAIGSGFRAGNSSNTFSFVFRRHGFSPDAHCGQHSFSNARIAPILFGYFTASDFVLRSILKRLAYLRQFIPRFRIRPSCFIGGAFRSATSGIAVRSFNCFLHFWALGGKFACFGHFGFKFRCHQSYFIDSMLCSAFWCPNCFKSRNSFLANNWIGPTRNIGRALFRFRFWRQVGYAIASFCEVSKRPFWPSPDQVNKVDLNLLGGRIGETINQDSLCNGYSSRDHILNDVILVGCAFKRIALVNVDAVATSLPDVERRYAVLSEKGIDVKICSLYGLIGHLSSSIRLVARGLHVVASACGLRFYATNLSAMQLAR